MRITISAKPNSKEEKIERIESINDSLVHVREKAEDNKANITLLKLLKSNLKKNVRIVKGLKSKNKIAKIED